MDFVVESWTYLAIDIIVVFGRFALRWKAQTIRGLNMDDYLMVIALLLYAAETATAHYVGAYWQGLANSGMTDEQRAAIDPGDFEYYLRVEGSKTQLFGWLVYTVLLWTLKLCWLFFYRRLGEGVKNMSIKINIGFAFVVMTFFATFFTILCGCWPIEKHWQIYPNPGNFCQPAVSRLQAWTLICTNLTTDFYIMTIPLPMIWNARLSGLRKLGLVIMLGGGVITAVFGGLRCGYVLQNSPDGPQLAGEWSCRESFVAVFISNIPVMFPLLRSYFNRFRAATSSQIGSAATPGGSKSNGKGPFKLSTMSSEGKKKKFKHPLSLPGETFYERYGSDEEIIDQQEAGTTTNSMNTGSSFARSGKGDDITVKTEWQVSSHKMNANEAQKERERVVTGFHAL